MKVDLTASSSLQPCRSLPGCLSLSQATWLSQPTTCNFISLLEAWGRADLLVLERRQEVGRYVSQSFCCFFSHIFGLSKLLINHSLFNTPSCISSLCISISLSTSLGDPRIRASPVFTFLVSDSPPPPEISLSLLSHPHSSCSWKIKVINQR